MTWHHTFFKNRVMKHIRAAAAADGSWRQQYFPEQQSTSKVVHDCVETQFKV